MATKHSITSQKPKRRKPANALPEWDDKVWAKMRQKEFAATMLRKLKAQGHPLITGDEMDALETWWKDTILTRRCALIMLTKTFKEIYKGVNSDREFAVAAADVCNRLPSLIEGIKGVAWFLDKSHIWLMLALAGRRDMSELPAAAKGDGEKPRGARNVR